MAVELVANLHFAWKRGAFFYGSDPSSGDAETEQSLASAGETIALVPYTGFALRPGVSVLDQIDQSGTVQETLRARTGSGELPSWSDVESNNLGFFSRFDYPVDPGGSLVVGFLGGSVAQWLAVQGEERLREQLEALPELRGRSVLVLNLGNPAFKQPQQLMVLAYLLALGQRFDFVVNVDGFNEVALGGLNHREGVDTSMPRARRMRGLENLFGGGLDERWLLFRAKLARHRIAFEDLRRRRDEAAAASQYLFWGALHRIERRRYRATLASPPPEMDAGQPPPPIELLAPRVDSVSDAHQQIVAEWARASVLMARLARGAGAHYVHVLQPNQYFGARHFSKDEAAIALNDDSPYREFVVELYPPLRRSGARLRSEGIDFSDSTGLFDAVEDPIYADDCCHCNQLGNELLMDVVFQRIAATLRSTADTARP